MYKYLAELTGSFFLVLALGFTGDAFSSGLLLVAVIYMGGQISGAHYNPAVTLAFWAAGRLQPGTLWTYLVSQVAGAFTGCLLIYFMTGTVFQTAPSSAASPFQYITVELLFAFLLCMVYLMLFLTRNFRNNQVYGLAIGLSYAGILMVGQPVTGGVFNPAVSLAVTFVDSFSLGGSYLYLPAYILAPSAGGIIAGNLFAFLVRSDHLLPEEV